MISKNEKGINGPEAKPSLKRILEALLFATSEPLSTARLSAVLKEFDGRAIQEALRELGTENEREGRPYTLVEMGGGYRLLTRPEYAEYIGRLQKISSGERLSPAALETLAIIAYKQPVIKAEVDAIRGVKTEGTIQSLLRRHLVRVVGRAPVLGRPLLYGTTKLFLDQFGLKSLEELPSPEEALQKMEAAEMAALEEGAQVTRVDLDADDGARDRLLIEALPDAPAFQKLEGEEEEPEEELAGSESETPPEPKEA